MNKILTIIPKVSVNGIPFGEHREAVRKSFGSCKEFKKSPFSTNTADDFGDFHIFYDQNNCFEAIEIFEAEVIIDNKTFFPGTLSNALTAIADLTSEEQDYWESKKQSVGLCAPDSQIESVLFGKTGYYE